MTPRVLLVVAALLVVLAGCSAPIDSSPASAPTVGAAEEGTTAPTVSVTATGQVEADPDLAVVRVAVTARAATADEARRMVADDVDSMQSALDDVLPAGSVRTSSFSISPEYDTGPERERDLVGYRAVHAFRVEVADVGRAGEVVDVAVANGADRVDGIEFTLSEDRRAALREQALGMAMDGARADADVLADAAGLSVSGPRSISTTDTGFVPFFADAERAGGGGTVFQPGPVTVTAHVDVVYALA